MWWQAKRAALTRCTELPKAGILSRKKQQAALTGSGRLGTLCPVLHFRMIFRRRYGG